MFSPYEGGPATATRSRRRQRPISSDSLIQPPKAKRQRLPLTEQTFVNPDAPAEMFQVKADKVAMLGGGNSKRDGIENGRPPAAAAAAPATPSAVAAMPKKELSVRSKKAKAGERLSKGDGSVVLASSSAYTVSKLPALPDRLRTDPGSRQHGAVYSSSGYAISLTHTHAIVWPYAATTPSPETFTFTLPYPSRHVSDPLPIGALVAPSASSEEPGLVVVMPTTGKVSYWESISSAATLDFLRQQRTGVEDVIPGLSSTEHVAEIVNAEPTGFILVTSNGRLAYLNVRDAHGRPAISVQFLRNTGRRLPASGAGSGGGGGFFGSIRHALQHGGPRENVVAVRAGPVLRVGERTIVAATSRGTFNAWRVHRGGSHDAVLEADARAAVVEAVQQVDTQAGSGAAAGGSDGADALEVVDFAFVPRGVERKYAEAVRLSSAAETASQAGIDADSIQQLLLLVSLPGRQQRRPYYLVELVLAPGLLQVGMVRPLSSLGSMRRQQQPTDMATTTATPTETPTEPPRLYLPNPAVVAYVVFAQAVVIASLAQPPETPDSQLQGEASHLPATFEDVVDLRSDGRLEIVGSGVEEPVGALAERDGFSGVVPRLLHKTKNPAAVLLVRGVGVVRVATVDTERFVSERPPQVTAKGKLEQAVFYGIKDDNPLVFEGGPAARQAARPFSDEEMGEAALELSRDILGSRTAFTPAVPASLESNLRQRASYLERLMAHLNAVVGSLRREVRWRLLWDAEKMHTATRMWVLHEQFLAERAVDGKTAAERKTIVSEIVEYIHEDEKKNPNRAAGEVDRVRHFFVHDVWRMDLFIAWAYEVIKYVYKDHLLDDRGVTRLLYEGVEVNLRALHGAAEFRQQRLGLYGLAGEELVSGILTAAPGAYAGLPEPWTSTYFITNNAKRLVDLCCNWLDQFYPTQTTAAGAPDPGLIEAIREALARLTDRYLVALQEHYRWTEAREEAHAAIGDGDAAGHAEAEAERAYGERCRAAYLEDRYAKVYRLKNYGLWEDAVEVAKKHESTTALAEIMVEEVRKLRSDAAEAAAAAGGAAGGGPARVAAEKRARAAAKEQRIAAYFGTYGEAFAFAVYEILLRDDGVKAVLDFPGDSGINSYATRFLRAKPALAKISWINDVERERDVAAAAQTLLGLGLEREPQVWNKKIELSLGKLAMLAGGRGEEEVDEIDKADIDQIDQINQIDQARADHIAQVDRQLDVIRIQDLVYSWVAPSIAAAVDEAAELQLAMESHATRIPKRQKAVVHAFEDGLRRLLRHEALDAGTLIDVLTLMQVPGSGSGSGSRAAAANGEDDGRVDEDVFFLALRVAEGGLSGEARRQAQRLVWRRCFLRDDWAQINNTQLQDDESTGAVLALTAPYQTAYALCIQNKFDAADYAVVRPSDALGAYTDAADPATAAHFGRCDDNARDKLLDAMRHEDVLLRRFIDKARLDAWVRTAVEAAEKACQAEVERLAGSW